MSTFADITFVSFFLPEHYRGQPFNRLDKLEPVNKPALSRAFARILSITARGSDSVYTA